MGGEEGHSAGHRPRRRAPRRPRRTGARPAAGISRATELTARAGRDHRPCRSGRSWPDRVAAAPFTMRPAGAPASGITGRVALVAGDRQSDGVFPHWSIAENISIRSLNRLAPRPADRRAQREDALAPSLAGADQHSHARHATTASCPCPAATSRKPCSPAPWRRTRDHPDGRSHARRRYRHQAGRL